MTGSQLIGTDLGPWAAQAACLGDNGELWFSFDTDNRHIAKAICQECPVRVDCLAHALETDERYGIWGGKDERERRAIRNRLLDRGDDG